MKIKLLILYILTIYSLHSIAQILDNDQARFDVKWEQIDLENYRLIFPQEFRKQASTLSHYLDHMRTQSSQDLRILPKKIPIILHANHIEQNGFVQLAPRKSEFFPIPSGVSSNVEWLPNLAIHELRHVAQMDKLTGKIKAPFFEQLAFAFYGLHLPAWYFEGDAVSIETQFSNGGRGRIPSWFMPIRANELSGKRYSFDKNILGSFKDIVPSYYTTGYLMNVHLTNQFGYDIKEKILDDMRGKLLRPFNFYKSLHHHTDGYNSRRLYKSAIDSLKGIWEEEAKNSEGYQTIPTPANIYPSHYLLPQYKEDLLFALLRSPQKISQIITIEDGKTNRLVYTGAQLMPYFHVNSDLIIWDELRKDARFGKNTFNIINVYNRNTRKTQSFDIDRFLYTPALHPQNTEFVAVKIDQTGKSSLTVYNLANQELLQEIVLPDGLHIQQPQYNEQGNRVICIGVNHLGTTLIEFDLTDNSYREIIPWSNQTLERPIYHQDKIIYKAHYNGTDNIYAYNQSNQTIYTLTNTTFGAFNPSIKNQDSIIFNDYLHDGYKIAHHSIAYDKPVLSGSIRELTYDNNLSHNESAPLFSRDTIIDTMIKPYNTLSGLFNFHSLSISSNNFDNFDNFKPGIFWLANDLLNTSQLKLGYEYDADIRKGLYTAELNYSKYYPKFTVGYQNRGQIGQAFARDSTQVNFDWREHLMTAEVQLPFSIYRRQTVYSYGLNFGTSYLQRYNVSLSSLQNFHETISFPLNYQVYFNKNMRRSTMDLQPRWGQNLSMTYRHVPFENKLEGDIFSMRTNFYFPGLFSNHGFQARFGYQKKEGRYQYTNDIPTVSAFGYFVSPAVNNTLLFTYRFPVAYPDWTIGPLAYVKRIQAQLFSDYQNIKDSSLAPKTFGLGLSADLNVFRYTLPDINIGTRITYINDPTASQKMVPTFSLSYSY